MKAHTYLEACLFSRYPGLSHLAIHKVDRVWYGFSSFPQLELDLVPCYGGGELLPRRSCLRQLVDRLLGVGEGRLHTILRRNLVYPNMNDVPVTIMQPILLASQPRSFQHLA